MKQTAINGVSKQELGIKYPDSFNLVEGKWISLQYLLTISNLTGNSSSCAVLRFVGLDKLNNFTAQKTKNGALR